MVNLGHIIHFSYIKKNLNIHQKFSNDSDTTSYKKIELEKFISTCQFRRKFALLFQDMKIQNKIDLLERIDFLMADHGVTKLMKNNKQKIQIF